MGSTVLLVCPFSAIHFHVANPGVVLVRISLSLAGALLKIASRNIASSGLNLLNMEEEVRTGWRTTSKQ